MVSFPAQYPCSNSHLGITGPANNKVAILQHNVSLYKSSEQYTVKEVLYLCPRITGSLYVPLLYSDVLANIYTHRGFLKAHRTSFPSLMHALTHNPFLNKLYSAFKCSKTHLQSWIKGSRMSGFAIHWLLRRAFIITHCR